MVVNSRLSDAHYRYEPLASKDSIRLLRLMPASKDEQELLVCELVHFPLSDAPSYEMISHISENPPAYQNIQVNSNLFPVGSNLLSALKHFVQARPRLLWVDTISINQADDQETKVQFALMPTIISNARRVLIWLGMSTRDTKRSFMCLKELAGSVEAYGIQSWSNSNDPVTLLEREMFDKLPSIVNLCELERIYGSSWFSRLRNLQEISNAQEAKICSGWYQIKFNDFVKATAVLKKFTRGQNRSGSQLSKLDIGATSSLITTWQMSSNDKVPGLFAKLLSRKRILYYLYHNRQYCTSDYDRIGAILGIERSHSLEFYPDYYPEWRVTIKHVYLNFAKINLERGIFDILGFAGILYTLYKDGLDQDPRERWPSWVPDWRFPEPLTEPFSCGTSWQAAIKLLPQVDFGEDENSSICVRGIILGSIDLGVVIVEPSSHTPDDALRQMAQYAPTAKALYDTHGGKGAYASGEESLTAFVRTITLDSNLSPANAVTSDNDAARGAVNMWLQYEDECAKWHNHKNFDQADRAQIELQNPWQFSCYAELLAARVKNRQFFITSGKYIGMAPWFALPGDKIAIFAGAETPFILRRSGDDDDEKYRVVADCYLHGFMYGELLSEELLSTMQRITII
ncbi:hypothetical protein MMC11_003548 [Xylographa trunciseda]|nr:hypothetical protein [Xylographa trunciseda]